MVHLIAAAGLWFLAGAAHSQSVGPSKENHPRLTTWKCTKYGGCKPQDTAIVLDSLAHPVYQRENPELNCGNWGQPANATVCPDQKTCQKNCIMDGIPDYSKFGITTNQGSLTLKQLGPDGSQKSPRVYLLARDKKKYEMIKLTDREFTFDVDVSALPCGMNGALYMSEMRADGGRNNLNKAGATMGTGYCDAQCFTTPFINGVGNLEGKGSCCNELDIWEANAPANSIAPHPCNKPSLFECEGDECGFEGNCDEWGCTYNPYKVGNKNYYGKGSKFAVDTSKSFTVVTQFPADKNGILKEIRRLYIQNGKVIPQAPIKVEKLGKGNSLTDPYCKATGARRFGKLGGLQAMGGAMDRGMVLAMSIWWDEGGNMNWLDSGEAGPCTADEGAPDNIRLVEPDPTVVFSNIKWGEIGSTYSKRPQYTPPKRDIAE